jgi:hypothetical protein
MHVCLAIRIYANTISVAVPHPAGDVEVHCSAFLSSVVGLPAGIRPEVALLIHFVTNSAKYIGNI